MEKFAHPWKKYPGDQPEHHHRASSLSRSRQERDERGSSRDRRRHERGPPKVKPKSQLKPKPQLKPAPLEPRLDDLEDEQLEHASQIAALQAEVQALRDLVCQLMHPPPPEWGQ